MPRIFISYRREDSESEAGRLYDALALRLGRDQVFRDIYALRPGEEFAVAIDRVLAASDVELVLIGRRWLTVADATGRRRLDDPADLHRREVATALKLGKLVIPVRLQGASMPAPADLPEDLVELAGRNAVELTDARWEYDVEKLAAALRPRRGGTGTRLAVRYAVAVGAVCVVGGAAVLLLRSFAGLPFQSPGPTTPLTAAPTTQPAVAATPSLSLGTPPTLPVLQVGAPPGSPTATLGQWRVFAGDPTASDLLSSPTGVAIDLQGQVYIADSGHLRVAKLSRSGSEIAQWVTSGPAFRPFQSVESVAIDRDGNTFVADYAGNFIQKLSPTGQPLARWGSPGKGPGQFDSPAGLAVDSQGNLYVVEEMNHRVQKLSPTGEPLAQWGVQGGGPGEFNRPPGLGLDAQGNIYVADWGNHRIQKLSPDGKPLAQWGHLGDGPGEFLGPFAVAVDSQGNIYIADREANRVQKLSPDGRPLAQWGADGGRKGIGLGQFNQPFGVAIDAVGNVYVADTYNNRIQELSPAGQ